MCVAVLNSREIGSWHCEHVSEPTNSAPGMLGGAITVRLTVEQEIAATVTTSTADTAISLLRLTILFLDEPFSAGELFSGGFT